MLTDNSIVTQQSIAVSVAEHGWACRVAAKLDADTVVNEINLIGDFFGTRATGRSGAIEELIRPLAASVAHPRSLSARYGLESLPLHVELSHRLQPCRYLLLGCIDPGSPGAVTLLFDWHTLDFSPDEIHMLESAPILVRAGRRSFYSTILRPDHTFLRYDPGCIEAIDTRGQAALDIVASRLANGTPKIHCWQQGDILVIDNWRVLHGRGPTDESSGRRLTRILIDA